MLSLGPAALAWVSGLAPYGYHLQFPSLLKGADRGEGSNHSSGAGPVSGWEWGQAEGRAMKELSGGC